MNSRTPPRKPETAHHPYNAPAQLARQRGGRRKVPATWTRIADMPESGITLREAAAYLGCGYETLWFLVSHGQLQAAIRASGDWQDGMVVTYGRIWRIRPAALAWVATHGLPSIDRAAAVGDDE